MHRKRYRNPFRSQVIDYLCRYDEIKKNGGETAMTIVRAIDVTFENMEESQDGKLMNQIISMLYIKKTHTAQGVAKELSLDRATVYRTVNRFIHKVCVEAKLIKS